ncbi:MAG: hypothetical protein J6568_06215 [Snodgrassella sp.]|nr:hypothetical protein [Snodgrassella sp.]
MRRYFVSFLFSLIIFTFCACSSYFSSGANRKNVSVSQLSVAVPYRVANHYFVKNNIKNKIPSRISNANEFYFYFGEATTMGNTGKPSNIDFNEEEVVIYDAGKVQQFLQIKPLDLRQSGRELHLIIHIQSGALTGYYTHPFLMLIIQKNLADKLMVHVQ